MYDCQQRISFGKYMSDLCMWFQYLVCVEAATGGVL